MFALTDLLRSSHDAVLKLEQQNMNLPSPSCRGRVIRQVPLSASVASCHPVNRRSSHHSSPLSGRRPLTSSSSSWSIKFHEQQRSSKRRYEAGKLGWVPVGGALLCWSLGSKSLAGPPPSMDSPVPPFARSLNHRRGWPGKLGSKIRGKGIKTAPDALF